MLIAAATAAALVLAAGAAYTGLTQPVDPSSGGAGLSWGAAGPYAPGDLGRLRDAGVQTALLEVSWAHAEPVEGRFDDRYLRSVRGRYDEIRRAGLRAVLSTGLHEAPGWLLGKPHARFVDQFDNVYTGSPEPNLVFATELRQYAQRYLDHLFSLLGDDFLAVRAGGGHWGELQYPSVEGPDGRPENRYYAFDAASARTNPVPGWRPGDPSPRGEARKFLGWYLDRLTEFQNWQVRALRRSYDGPVSVLYASWGMRPGDFERAVSTNLSGTSPAELSGEVQRGFAHARHIAGLEDRDVAVWGTWADKVGTLDWLAKIARSQGLAVMGENAAGGTASDLHRSAQEARRQRLRLLMWIRTEDLTCECRGLATLDQLSDEIASG